MTTKENLIRFMLDKRVLVCAGLLFSMSMTTGFISNRHVTIAVDGHAVELTTPYRTPDNILSQAGVTMQDEDELELSFDENGNEVFTVKRAVPVTVEFEGKKEEIKTCKTSVADIVEGLGYVGNTYTVEPGLEAAVESGMNIKVALAKKEPEKVITTSQGNVEYQDCITMEATAYLPTDGDGRGITATGIRATYGVVAVDPGYIPLGTRLYIPGYGFAVAADTGGAIRGGRIDLCMESYNEAMRFGRRDVNVYVLD